MHTSYTQQTLQSTKPDQRTADRPSAFFLPFFGESEHFCHPANRHSLQIGENPGISVDKLWTLWIIRLLFALRDVDKSSPSL